MVQLFDFRQKRVLDVSKKALDDWVKNYQYSYEDVILKLNL
jgi:hypothetical protein